MELCAVQHRLFALHEIFEEKKNNENKQTE